MRKDLVLENKLTMINNSLHQIIDIWISELDHYDFEQLKAKPAENSWSLGQMYMHLIGATKHFLQQAGISLKTNENEHEKMTERAEPMFKNNQFPDAILEGPESNAYTPQPHTKEAIIESLKELQKEIYSLEELLAKNAMKGKTKHPGLGFFNGREWVRFAEMHFRHHLRQKKRIDLFLKKADRF